MQWLVFLFAALCDLDAHSSCHLAMKGDVYNTVTQYDICNHGRISAVDSVDSFD